DNYIQNITKIKADEIREIPKMLSAILFISKNTKQRQEQAKETAIALVNGLPNWFKTNILNSILEHNILSKEELNQIAEEVPNWIEKDNPTSYFLNKNKLEAGLRLYNSLELPLNRLYELLAQNEDLIIKQHPQDTDFVKYISIGAKAKYFRLAGKAEEAEECFKKYNRLKQTVKLGKVSTQLGDKETEMFNEYLNMKSGVILEMPTDIILALFSINEDILVDANKNEEYAKESIKKSIWELFST